MYHSVSDCQYDSVIDCQYDSVSDCQYDSVIDCQYDSVSDCQYDSASGWSVQANTECLELDITIIPTYVHKLLADAPRAGRGKHHAHML